MMSPSAALLAAWLCASALILKVQSGPLTEAELDSVLLRFRQVSPAAFAPGQRSLISTKTQPISAASDGIAGLSWGQGTHVLEVKFGPDGTQPKVRCYSIWPSSSSSPLSAWLRYVEKNFIIFCTASFPSLAFFRSLVKLSLSPGAFLSPLH